MRDYFIYDGVPSTDFGTFLAESNLFDSAGQDIKHEEVPGRNGDLLIANDRFKNLDIKAKIYIPERLRENLPWLKAFLLSKKGYRRYAESYNPEYYRMAVYQDGFTMGSMNRWRGTAEITFNCKPQVFLVEGDVVRTYTQAATLFNPTYYAAQPLLRVYGFGYLYVGPYAIHIAQNNLEYIDIDCERMDAYNGAINCNGLIAIESDFPILDVGETEISFSNTITRVDITPRWWTL